MPNTDGFHIYIHLDDFSDDTAMAGDTSNQNKKSAEQNDPALIQKVAKRIVGYAAIKSTADQIITGELRQVSLTTGASEYEKRQQIKYSVGSQIVDAGVGLGIAASVGGLPGFVLALTGLAVSAIHKGISYAQDRRALAKQENLEDVSIDLMNIRAGVTERRNRNQ